MTEDEHPAATDEIGGGPVDGCVAEFHRTVGTEGGEATRAEPPDLIHAGADGAVGEIRGTEAEDAAAGEFQIAAWQRGGVLQAQDSIRHGGAAGVGVGIGEREHAGARLVQSGRCGAEPTSTPLKMASTAAAPSSTCTVRLAMEKLMPFLKSSVWVAVG